MTTNDYKKVVFVILDYKDYVEFSNSYQDISLEIFRAMNRIMWRQ